MIAPGVSVVGVSITGVFIGVILVRDVFGVRGLAGVIVGDFDIDNLGLELLNGGSLWKFDFGKALVCNLNILAILIDEETDIKGENAINNFLFLMKTQILPKSFESFWLFLEVLNVLFLKVSMNRAIGFYFLEILHRYSFLDDFHKPAT